MQRLLTQRGEVLLEGRSGVHAGYVAQSKLAKVRKELECCSLIKGKKRKMEIQAAHTHTHTHTHTHIHTHL